MFIKYYVNITAMMISLPAMRRIVIHACELCVVLCLCSSEQHLFTIKNVLLTPMLKSKRPYYDSILLQRLSISKQVKNLDGRHCLSRLIQVKSYSIPKNSLHFQKSEIQTNYTSCHALVNTLHVAQLSQRPRCRVG